jgi:hypothetical protein
MFLEIVPDDEYEPLLSINLGINHNDTDCMYSYYFICHMQQDNRINFDLVNSLLDLSKKQFRVVDRNRINLFIKQNPNSKLHFVTENCT